VTKQIELRDKVLMNAAARGNAGATWLANLPAVGRRLEADWVLNPHSPDDGAILSATEAVMV
jgi:hypothetical protein